MRWMNDLWFRVRALVGRRAMERELDEELAHHLEMEARKLQAQGMSAREARRVSRVRFGGEARFHERARDAWGVTPLYDATDDVHFAARQLRKRPAFSALAALTLALGIGGTVALFSVVNGLMLRPLPFADEERLVAFWMPYDWRGAEYDFVRERLDVFEDVAAYSDDASTLRTEAGSRLVLYTVGSANMFDVLGAEPMLGRTFVEGEDRPGAEPVVVLDHGFWQREMGGDRDVLGRRIELGGVQRTVIGVMPEGFFFSSPESELWIPLDLDPASRQYEDNGWLVLAGRLPAGATPVQAGDELERITAQMGERWDYPEQWDKTRDPRVVPMRQHLLGDVRPALLLLLAAVGVVLLMACVNVTALLLTRTADRVGEMGVRTALGAGRGRIARQVLTESLLLGLVSGAIGTGLAVAAFDVLVAALPLPRELGRTLTLDWTTLSAALVLAVVTGALVSLGPMRSLLRGDLSGAAFGSRGQAGVGTARSRTQRALVASEVLLAVVLASGAALLTRTVDQLRAIDWGLDPEGVLTYEVIRPEDAESAATGPTFHASLVERVRALPGVQAAGITNRVPVRDGGWQGSVSFADRPDLTGDRRPTAFYRPVTPGVLDALGVELLEGRGILPSDDAAGERVAVVNQSLARTIFGSQSAVGRTIDRTGFGAQPIRIVGVIRDVAVDRLIGDVPMAAYYAWAQTLDTNPYAVLVVKTALEPTDLVAPIRAVITELDPRAADGRIETMQDVADAAMAEPLRLRFFLTLFSVLGVVLGTVGVYGVVSYSVQRQSAEFGIRLALGAAPRHLLASVVRGGMLPVVIGVLAGTAVALAGSSVLAGFLFGVEPTDPISLSAAAATLLLAGAGAALLPALRASATDPAVALRAE